MRKGRAWPAPLAAASRAQWLGAVPTHRHLRTLQATARVLNASEPLRTLRELCQNFPFVAKSLSRAKVSREIEDEVAGLQARVWGEGFSGAFLNGRALPVVHENNLIGLLQTLQRELRTVDRLASLGLPASAVTSLISLPSP